MNFQELIDDATKQQQKLVFMRNQLCEFLNNNPNIAKEVNQKDHNIIRKLNHYPADITFARVAKVWKLVKDAQQNNL